MVMKHGSTTIATMYKLVDRVALQQQPTTVYPVTSAIADAIANPVVTFKTLTPGAISFSGWLGPYNTIALLNNAIEAIEAIARLGSVDTLEYDGDTVAMTSVSAFRAYEIHNGYIRNKTTTTAGIFCRFEIAFQIHGVS